MNAGANAKGAEKLQRAQREYGGERKRRRSYAEVAKEIPKLFGKGLNQCLCGLQGINGWEGAWGLVVGVLPCASVVLAAVVAAACTFQNWICFDTEANIAIRHSHAAQIHCSIRRRRGFPPTRE